LTDTASFTSFAAVGGTASYCLDRRVLRIDSLGIAEYNTDTGYLDRWVELRDGTAHRVPRSGHVGQPRLYTAQAANHTLRLYPTPDTTYLIEMSVRRLPLRDLLEDDDVCEIPEDYQLALCDYAAWRALKNNNPEGANMAAAGEFRSAYELQVRDAKRDLATLHGGASAQVRNNWTGKPLRAI